MENAAVRFLRNAITALALALAASNSPQLTYAATGPLCYVDIGALGANNGDTWEDAYVDLQDALAEPLCAQIWAAAGTYYPGTERTDTFTLKTDVEIYGGFDSLDLAWDDRDPVANVTTLSGDIGAPADASDNSYHVVTASGTDSTAVLDGFTIQQGMADGYDFDSFGGGLFSISGSPTLANLKFYGNHAQSNGGGMYNEGGSPSLTSVDFAGNEAYSYDGGGMYNEGGSPALTAVTFQYNFAGDAGGGMHNEDSSPSLTNVTFTNNHSASNGGGMDNEGCNLTLTDVTFSYNGSGRGAAIANYGTNLGLSNATFSYNTASVEGGAIYHQYGFPGSDLSITDATFVGNQAGYGGAISNQAGKLTLTGATFWENIAAYHGGAILEAGANSTLTNLTLRGNRAAYGGGMYVDSSSPTLNHATFSGNGATTTAGAMYLLFSSAAISNSILWGNGSEIYAPSRRPGSQTASSSADVRTMRLALMC